MSNKLIGAVTNWVVENERFVHMMEIDNLFDARDSMFI